MRGLLSDVDSDMRSGDVDAGDGGHDGRGDEERQQQRQQQEKRGGEEPRALAVLCELNEFCKETTKGKNIVSHGEDEIRCDCLWMSLRVSEV